MRWKVFILLSIVALLYGGYALNRWRLSPNRNGAKLTEVQQFCSKVPLFPGFRETDSYNRSDYTGVDLTRHFGSNAAYDDVKAYYTMALTKDGWSLAGENSFGRGELNYRKGEFSISIFAAPASAGYDYAIDCVWSTSSDPQSAK